MILEWYRRYSRCVILAVIVCHSAHAQDSIPVKYEQMAERYASVASKKTEAFNKDLERYTTGSLERLIRQEEKMKKKLSMVDSIKARALFTYAIDSLKKFQTLIKAKTGRVGRFFSGGYFPYLDTLKQSLSFLNKAREAAGTAEKLKSGLDASLSSVDEMEGKLETVGKLDEYLKQRESVLQDLTKSYPGLTGGLQHFNKEMVYYRAQVSEYKNVLQDPEKIERLALTTLQKLPAFQSFVQQNSQLAGFFATPPASSGPGGIGTSPVVNGLPSRAAVQQVLQQAMPSSTGGDPTQLMQQQISDGQAQLDNLQNKLKELGKGSANAADIPNFIPNSQHAKSFWRRLEYGVNAQFGSSHNYLPATGDFGLQVGYKLNDKSSAGVGITYKMGLGSGWNHIRLSNEAIGFRTYLKWKAGRIFFIQGEGEWNYMSGFSSIAQLQDVNAWQTSALIGAGKEYKINKKLSGNIMLLYDVLYHRHTPASQPLTFRFGYNF